MNKFLKIAAIAALAAVLGVVALSAVAFAQGPDDGRPFGGWHRQAPFGQMGGGWLHTEANQARMHTAIAEAVGLSVDEFETAIADGQTLAQIAAAQGVDLAEVWTVMQTVRQEIIDQAVADGLLTPERAEWLSQRMAGHGYGPGGYGPGDCTGDGPLGGRGGQGFGARPGFSQ